MAGRIAVVDPSNRFVRWEDRHTIHVERLPHRSVYIVVFDSRGRLLVQKRAAAKQTHPDHWDISCAGHVEESDYPGGPDDDLEAVYRNVAIRELQEELGIAPAITLIDTSPPIEGVNYEHIALYVARHDGDVTLQAEEVSESRWLSRAEIEHELADGEFLVTPALYHFVTRRWTEVARLRSGG